MLSFYKNKENKEKKVEQGTLQFPDMPKEKVKRSGFIKNVLGIIKSHCESMKPEIEAAIKDSKEINKQRREESKQKFDKAKENIKAGAIERGTKLLHGAEEAVYVAGMFIDDKVEGFGSFAGLKGRTTKTKLTAVNENWKYNRVQSGYKKEQRKQKNIEMKAKNDEIKKLEDAIKALKKQLDKAVQLQEGRKKAETNHKDYIGVDELKDMHSDTIDAYKIKIADLERQYEIKKIELKQIELKY